MKKLKKFMFLVIVFIAYLILTTNTSSASSMDKLNFDVQVNSDGSMDVVENWSINVVETNTLFKTFRTDTSKYKNITNVEVADVTSSRLELRQINELMYHVTKNCYYGMMNDDGDFEIAWGVGLDNSRGYRKYEISYRVNGAISKHADYAELYWQFIGRDFEIPIENITGTILLPSNVESKDQIKVWGHSEALNGEIYAIDTNKIEFKLTEYTGESFVEIRSLFPTDMIISSPRKDSKKILESVVAEETQWANEANAKRTVFKIIKVFISLIATIVAILLDAWIISKIVKYSKKKKEIKKIMPIQDIKYFRELPRDDASPAQAAFILKQKFSTSFNTNELGKVFAATLLDLNLKGFIDFEVDANNKNNINILVKDNQTNMDKMTYDEELIYRFMQKVYRKETNLNVKSLNKYIKGHSSEIVNLQELISSDVIDDLSLKNIIDKDKIKEKSIVLGAASIFIAIIFIFVFFGISLYEIIYPLVVAIVLGSVLILSIIATIKSVSLSKKINIFTQTGVDEKAKWQGLKNYMNDFSLLKEKEVPDIVLWEHFLVYATTFGIAEKVLEQLKVVYPEFEKMENIHTQTI